MTVKSEARGVGTAGKSRVIYNEDVDRCGQSFETCGFFLPFLLQRSLSIDEF